MGILDYAINLSVCVTAISLIYYNLYVCIPSVCVQYSLLVFTTISMHPKRNLFYSIDPWLMGYPLHEVVQVRVDRVGADAGDHSPVILYHVLGRV